MDLSNSNAPMNFDEHIQDVLVLKQIRTQRESGRFCDVVFHVNHKQYVAHRNIVAACSPYFDSVFDMSKTPKEHLSVVCQDNVAFEMLIDYMYTGKITIHRDHVIDLLRLANHFMVTKVKDYCCEYLERNINVSTCFSTKENADKCGCPTLSQNLHYFILCNISEVVRQNEILEFTFAKLEHILSNKLYSLRQEEKFQLILKWTKWDLQDREPFFKSLLSFINWSSFSLDEIYNSLKVNDIYVNSDTCLFHLLQVLADNGVDLRCHVDVLQHLRARIQALRETPSNSFNTEPQPPLSPRGVHTDSVSDNLPTHQQPYQAHKVAISHKSSTNSGNNANNKDASTFNLTPQNQKDATLHRGPSYGPHHSDSGGEEMSEQDNSEVDDPPSPYTDGAGIHKGEEIPTNISQKSQGKDEGNVLKPKRMAGPPKRFPFEDYDDCTSGDNEDEIPKSGRRKETEKNPKILPKPQLNRDSRNTNSVAPTVQGRRGRRRKERLQCPKCEFLSCSESKLKAHVRFAHKDEDVFICNICEFSCRWNRQYYKHMKSHFDGPPYKCDQEACDYSIDRIQALLYHRMRHSGERPYQCTECDQRFLTKNNLKTHLKSHTGEKPFKCDVCNRCFATKGTLDQHSVTHSNLRPFLCELCGFSTKYQSHLILHKRVHKGEVFKCQYPKCDYSTPKRSQLSCHMRTHMQVKSHMCTTCGRGFTEKSHLVRHERIHSEEKPFKCDLCDYSSTRRDKLKDHTKKHHEENNEEKIKKSKKMLNKVKEPEMVPGLPVLSDEGMGTLPEDAIVSVDDGSLGLDERDLLRSSVVTTLTTVTSPATMTMLDSRSLGLLLPTVVSIDGRDDPDQDHFRNSLMVGSAHHQLAMGPDDDSNGPDAFLNSQSPSLQLQQLQSNSIHLATNPVTDFQGSVSHPGHSSPEIPGLASFMNIF